MRDSLSCQSGAACATFVQRLASVSQQNLSLRLPAELHKQMKKAAKEAGVTASQYYGEVLTRFLDNHVDQFLYFFTGPGSSAVTLYVGSSLVARLREVADNRDSHMSDLAISALIVHFDKHPFPLAA
jgi:hypothetical protein